MIFKIGPFKHLARQTKKKKKLQITSVRNEREVIITDNMDIKRVTN